MGRMDGRTADEMRRVKITRHYLKHPAGSVLIEVGNTKVICAASIEERVPHFLKGSGEGWITAEYALLRWLFRRDLRVSAGDRDAPPPPELPYFVLIVLVLTLIGFGVTSLLGLAPAWAAQTSNAPV